MTWWAIVFSVLVFYALQENRNRVDEIQQARLSSCERTYEGVREIFKPFLSAPPATAKQKKDRALFNSTVDELKANCAVQTKTKESP